MITFVGGPAEKVADHLLIRRAPLFLRVVCDDKGKWDALDQLSDEPRFTEKIYAYRLTRNEGSIHLCMRGGKGGTFQHATYRYIEPQPTESVLRYRSHWRKWCEEMVAEEVIVEGQQPPTEQLEDRR